MEEPILSQRFHFWAVLLLLLEKVKPTNDFQTKQYQQRVLKMINNKTEYCKTHLTILSKQSQETLELAKKLHKVNAIHEYNFSLMPDM